MKYFIVMSMAIALAASAAVDTENKDEKLVKSAKSESKKTEKRGLFDLGYGYESHYPSAHFPSAHYPSAHYPSAWEAPAVHHEYHHEPITITKTIPVPITVEKHIPVPYKVPVHYPVYIEKKVNVPVPYPVEKKVYIEKHVDRPVPYPVKVPVYHKVHVEVPKPVYIEKQVPVIVKDHGWSPHAHYPEHYPAHYPAHSYSEFSLHH